MLDNVLVLSPHRDDEVLGVGGTLLKCKKIHIHYFNNFHPTVSQDVYDAEAEQVKNLYNATTSYSSFMEVNRLHTQPLINYIKEIEWIIDKHKPTTVFVPMRSRNQDHQVVYDAAMVATRFHDKNWFVPNIFIYEQSEYTDHTFIPQLYVPIDVLRKFEVFKLYDSQQRGHRTEAHIAALAILRGMEVNTHFAEAFMVKRQLWIPS